MTDEKKERLSKAIADRTILFFVAKRGHRAVGMCSVATSFSAFSCGEVGFFDDFYIKPIFRKKGITRRLTEAGALKTVLPA